MSKSDPNSAIFMEDSAADVQRKIGNAFCPERRIDGNPCIKYITLIVMPWAGSFCAPASEGGITCASVVHYAHVACAAQTQTNCAERSRQTCMPMQTTALRPMHLLVAL